MESAQSTHADSKHLLQEIVLVGGISRRDKYLTFDEPSHVYKIKGNPTNGSVTKLVEKFFDKFDSARISNGMVRGDTIPIGYEELLTDLDISISKNKPIAAKRLRDEWIRNGKEQSGLGTAMHEAIEHYYQNNRHIKDKTVSPASYTYEFGLFLKFDAHIQNLGYLPYRTEQRVWDSDYNIAGSVDMMYIKQKHLNRRVKKIWLVDWKRSKEIKEEGYKNKATGVEKMGTGPCAEWGDCNYKHYCLQLNIYKFLLEKHYKLKIVKMSLLVFHPNNETYLEYDVPSTQDVALAVLESNND